MPTDTTYDLFKCYPEQIPGNTCGIGEGLCDDNGDCLPTDETQTTFACAPKGDAGDTCLDFGFGNCKEPNACFLDAAGTANACYAPQETGQTCGAGIGLCLEDAECIVDVMGEEAATCLANQATGAVCGAGIGLCEAGSDCFPTATGSDSAMCYASEQAEGEACGDGIGYCEPFLLCINWADVTASIGTCVPLVLAGAACNVLGNAICYTGTTCIPENDGSEDWICAKNGYVGDTCGYGNTGWCVAPLGCKLTSETTGTCEADPCAALYEDETCDTEGCLYLDPACE
jgi:hypothetical protein